MKVAITGGTGSVGRSLVPLLRQAGHTAIVLTRDAEKGRQALPEGVEIRELDPHDVDANARAIAGADAVVNLQGESLMGGRWWKGKRAAIRASRVLTTRALVQAMHGLSPRPKVLVSASAVGIYGPRDPDVVLDEYRWDAAAFAGQDFLAEVCRSWEMAVRDAESLGVREVRLRLGVVLKRGEGALRPMERALQKYVGGPLGSGKQVVSWIHHEDLARLILFALDNDQVQGAVNATAPNPVSQRELCRALGAALGKPCWLRTPGFALRLLLGKAAELALSGQRVIPARARSYGFVFRYPTIDAALGEIYRSEPSRPAASAA